jgi:hypothetical protein
MLAYVNWTHLTWRLVSSSTGFLYLNCWTKLAVWGVVWMVKVMVGAKCAYGVKQCQLNCELRNYCCCYVLKVCRRSWVLVDGSLELGYSHLRGWGTVSCRTHRSSFVVQRMLRGGADLTNQGDWKPSAVNGHAIGWYKFVRFLALHKIRVGRKLTALRPQIQLSEFLLRLRVKKDK